MTPAQLKEAVHVCSAAIRAEFVVTNMDDCATLMGAIAMADHAHAVSAEDTVKKWFGILLAKEVRNGQSLRPADLEVVLAKARDKAC